MGEIALDPETEEWTPEFLMELGKEWIEKSTLEKARKEGLRRGIQEGEVAILMRQLKRRFGTLPDAVLEKLSSADEATLETWGDRILDAQTLEEVFDG